MPESDRLYVPFLCEAEEIGNYRRTYGHAVSL